MKSNLIPSGVFLLLILQGCATPSSVKQEFFLNPPVAQQLKVDTARSDHFDYLLFIPKVVPGKTYRLIMTLHGAGSTMKDYLEIWEKMAFEQSTFVVAPQLDPSTFLFNKDQDASLYFNLIESLKRRYSIDPERIYIEGASVGGGTAKWLVEKNPEYWRGGIFIASVGFLETFERQDQVFIEKLKHFPPLLYVQGLKDTDNLDLGLDQIEFLINHGVQVQLYSYEDAGHEHRPEWNERIFQWMENVEKVSSKRAV